MKRAALLTLAFLTITATAPASYHFLHYKSVNGTLTAIPEKFDVDALPGHRILFYVESAGPAVMAGGDSFTSVLSQIRRAGELWNRVPTSALRVGFGGLFDPSVPQTGPRIEITFDEDMPPGIVALGGPEVADTTAAGPFQPITRSVLRLGALKSGNTSRPSWDQSFFMSLAHEFGHTLGLQHSFTSGLMSAAETRAVTAAQPMTADDTAAISLLYPAADFGIRLGSISGRVTLDGSAVHLASVVAVTPSGHAVGALTAPDGTYTIKGLRARDYFLYVQALPPAWQPGMGPGDLVLPTGPDGNAIPAGPLFKTQFYPGTTDSRAARLVRVREGETTPAIDFAVQATPELKIHDPMRFSFPAQIAIRSGQVNAADPNRSFLVMWAYGIMENGAPAPGLSMRFVGDSTVVRDGGIITYPWDPQYLQVNVAISIFAMYGPRHLVISRDGDIYVFPAAVNLCYAPPPVIASVERGPDAGGDPTVVVRGSGFGPYTRVMFDGAAATVLSLDESQQMLTVIPPPAPPGHQAHIEALNPDGQVSSFVQDPPVYTYDGVQATVSLSRTAFSAGSESMVEITGVNTRFTEGLVDVTASSDAVIVRNTWVVSPTLIRADIAVRPGATPGPVSLSVFSGLRRLDSAAMLQVQAAGARPSLGSDLTESATGERYVHAGTIAAIPVTNGGSLGSGLMLSVADKPARIVSVSAARIEFEVPDLPGGPAIVKLTSNGSDAADPILVVLDAKPPQIIAEWSSYGTDTAQRGEVLALSVAALGDSNARIDTDRVRIWVGGVPHYAYDQIIPFPGRPGYHVITVALSQSVQPGASVPVIVSLDGHASQAPYNIKVF